MPFAGVSRIIAPVNAAKPIFFSIIIPTFKRADEVIECCESLSKQKNKHFELILADGTPGESLEKHVEEFKKVLDLTFLYEEYLGVSEARNLGAQHAKGDYFIFLDSDCIIPEDYTAILQAKLSEDPLDAFGGPDAAHESFTTLQKAISYSMTSLLTTGGIRGQKQHVGQFHPRGFNMGFKRAAFEATGGFSEFKCGEDIELSIRLLKMGYRSGLIPEAFVFHKRRTSLKQFFRQVYRFGAARINIFSRHREELKLTHLFPVVFFIGLILLLLSIPFYYITPIPTRILSAGYGLYFIANFLLSLLQNKRLPVAALSVVTAVVQLSGYGKGFLDNAWEVLVKGNKQGLKL